MKRGRITGVFLILSLVVLQLYLVSASAVVNSNTSSVSLLGVSGNITGKINISISNEPYNAKLKAVIGGVTSEIALKDFLDKNLLTVGTHYSCSVSSCGDFYNFSNPLSSKTVSLAANEGKTVGILIPEDSATVTFFNMTISGNVPASCSLPLKADLLDDNITDWAFNKASTETCNKNYGDFDSSKSSNSYNLDINSEYCNKFILDAFPRIKIGASLSITGSGTSSFTMSIVSEDGSISETCDFSASSSGEFSCDVNISNSEMQTFDVCIGAVANNNYKINYETDNSSGYIAGFEENKKDFAIFVQPYKFATFNSASLEDSDGNIATTISEYLGTYFNGKCPCVIPINIISGASQSITLSNLKLDYQPTTGGLTTASNFADVSTTPSFISMGYRSLDLSKARFSAPSAGGNYTFALYLGNNLIYSKPVNLESSTAISEVYPSSAPLAVETNFIVYHSVKNPIKYKWFFGDSSSAETTKQSVSHIYNSLGKYNLKIQIFTASSNYSSTFVIEAVSPQAYILSKFNETRTKASSLKNQLKSFPDSIKSYYTNLFSLDSIDTSIAKLEADYNNAGQQLTKYIAIIQSLNNLSVPNSISVIESSSVKYLFDKEIVNPDIIATISGETKAGSDTQYKNGALSWFSDSLDVRAESQTYGTFSDGIPEKFVTQFKFTVTPKSNVGQYYFIIGMKKSEFTLSDASLASQVKEAGDSSYIVFSDSAPKTIEFTIFDRKSVLDVPLYFATQLSLLPSGVNVGVCNYNSICEADKGEDYNNCRSDCKPIGLTILWLSLLLVAFFAAYIALQEWYKRHYESALFKDSNDLFNLIHFIENADKQKLVQKDIFNKLIEKGWTKEQIEYAYRKYRGERTGMWEVPIFKFLENRKVKEELDKRKSLGVNPNITPSPIKMFAPSALGNRPSIPSPVPPTKPLNNSNNAQKLNSQKEKKP